MPRLKTVSLLRPAYEFFTIGEVTTGFVLSRIKHDHPISLLDLRQAPHVESSALNLLQGITGLEVLPSETDRFLEVFGQLKNTDSLPN